MMRTFTTFMIAMFLLGAVAAAQKRDLKEEEKRRQQGIDDPPRYEAMLDAYLAGDLAHSVELLADPGWDETRLKLVVRNVDADAAHRWNVNRWCAAALMHVDVALALPGGIESYDAQTHLLVTSELVRLGVLEKGKPIALFAERLYFAVARLFVDRGHALTAERILAVARKGLPGHPMILYASGSVAELFATNYALGGSVTFTEANGFDLPFAGVMMRRNMYLNEAAAWFRQAAALVPADDLLRVHLGRALSLKKEDEAAARLLTAVAETGRDDATVYLASLFLGGLRARQGRMDDAVAAYRGALGRLPAGHAAAVGLSEALLRTGQADEARAVLLRVVSQAHGEIREPLWWYLFDPPGVAEERFDSLRREVRR